MTIDNCKHYTAVPVLIYIAIGAMESILGWHDYRISFLIGKAILSPPVLVLAASPLFPQVLLSNK
jgi:hypothetical protein